MPTHPSATNSVPQPVADPAETQALADAASAAGHAPSLHGVQPWRWTLSSDELNLFVDHGHTPQVAAGGSLLPLLDCGVALHHAFISLAADGWHAIVSRLPATEHPDHLAQIRLDHPIPVEPAARQRLRAVVLRHADRRPALSVPVDADKLRSLTAAVESEGARLQLLRPDEVLDLVVTAHQSPRLDSPRRPKDQAPEAGTGGEELAGNTLLAQSQARTARFAVLHGPQNRRLDWLRAGEALSAAWLTATALGLSVLPLPSAVEMAATREVMRRRLPGTGYPYLLVRFATLGHAAAGSAGPPPRITDQRIERV
jgi:nitroreductase